jgi:hypothetical protein
MPLKLNKTSDERTREMVVRNRESLRKFLTAEPSSPIRSNPVRYARQLANISLNLGLDLYQQEGDPAEIRDHFARACRELFAVLTLDSDKAALEPLEFQDALALAACFCPPSVSGSADKVPISKFFPDAKAFAFYAILTRYLDVLRCFLTSGKLDHEAWDKVEAECLRGNAGRYDAQLTLAKLRALRAVDTSDHALLNQSIATLIEDHENEAKRGGLRQLSQGFICLPALMFAHLGTARNLSCTVKSLYLPLQLLSH